MNDGLKKKKVNKKEGKNELSIKERQLHVLLLLVVILLLELFMNHCLSLCDWIFSPTVDVSFHFPG